MNSLAMIKEQGRVVNYRVIVYLKYFRASHLGILLSVTYHALRGLFGSSIAMMSVCGKLDLRERHRAFNSARSGQHAL